MRLHYRATDWLGLVNCDLNPQTEIKQRPLQPVGKCQHLCLHKAVFSESPFHLSSNPRRMERRPESQGRRWPRPGSVGWQVSITEISGIGWRNRAISRRGASPFCKGLLGFLRVRSKKHKAPSHLLESQGQDVGVDTLFITDLGATWPSLVSSAHLCLLGSQGIQVPILLGPSIPSAPVLPADYGHSHPSEHLVTSEQAQLFPFQRPRGRCRLDLGHPEMSIYKPSR